MSFFACIARIVQSQTTIGIIRVESAWAITEPCACAVAEACSAGSPKCSTGRGSGFFCGSWKASASRRVILIIDNAKYHRARLPAQWRAEKPADFDLDFLPPYSPEFNPIERVWKRTRRNRLHHANFPKLASGAETVEAQFAKGSEPNHELASLCVL
jgi:hypothetical protein